MKAKILFLSSFIICFTVCAYAAETDQSKLDVQRLKEQTTELNNAMPFKDPKSIGNSFSIGIPVGLYLDDTIVGLDFAYPITNHISIRLDAHLLMENPGSKDKFSAIASPTLGLIGKSSLFYNMKTYGGIFIGTTYELNGEKNGPFFQFKGLGGIEIYNSAKTAFFIEIGGGAALSGRDLTYTRGAFVTGGSRFYL